MVGAKHVIRKGDGRGSNALARLRHEFLRFREEVGCIRSLPSLHRRWPSLARLEIDSEASSEDGSSWGTEELARGCFPPSAAHGGKANCLDKENSVYDDPPFPDSILKSSSAGDEFVREVPNLQQNGSLVSCTGHNPEPSPVRNESADDLCDVVESNPLRPVPSSAQSLSVLDAESLPGSGNVEHSKGETEFIQAASSSETSSERQELLDPSLRTAEQSALWLGRQEVKRNCTSDAFHVGGNEERAADLTNNIEAVENNNCHQDDDLNQQSDESDAEEELAGSYYEGHTKTSEDHFKSVHDRNVTEVWRLEDPSYDEALDSTRTHSGARTTATAYFTANPRHSYHNTLFVPHRHSESEREDDDLPSPVSLTFTSCQEGKSCNQHVQSNLEHHVCSLRKFTASSPSPREGPTPQDVGRDSLEAKDESADEEDMKALGTHVNLSSDQLIQTASVEDCKRNLKLVGYVYEEVPSGIPAQTSEQFTSSSSPDLGERATHASVVMMRASSAAEKQVDKRVASKDLMPSSSQSCTASNAAASRADGRHVERQGAGNSSLIALTGLDGLTTLGDEHRHDHGLAARMATRIRNALEELRKLRRRLRFKTESVQPEPKTIGGSRYHYSEGWLSADPSGLAANSRGSAGPVEPEAYLQNVIAALDSANEPDVQEEDSSQELSSPPEDARKKHDSRISAHHRPHTHVEGGRASGGVPHQQQHCYHWRSSPLQRTGSSICPVLRDGRPCCSEEIQEDPSLQKHLHYNCTAGCRRLSFEDRSSHTLEEGFPRVVRNSGTSNLSLAGMDSANPQAFSVRINGSMVEIEVGDEPPSITWNPRGPKGQTVAVRTSSNRSEGQKTTGSANDELFDPTASMNGQENSPRTLPDVSDLAEADMVQTNGDFGEVRFRDPILPSRGSKSVRFYAAAKDPGQEKVHTPRQIRENFDNTVKSLARQAQGSGAARATGESATDLRYTAGLGQEKASGVRMRQEAISKRRLAPTSPESLVGRDSFENNVAESISFKNRYGVTVPVAANSQEEEPSRSILKSPRGTSDSGYDVQTYSRVIPTSKMTDNVKHSGSVVTRPVELKGRTAARRSILKVPKEQAFSSRVRRDGLSRADRTEDGISDMREREILEAAGSGLADELEILNRSRSPGYLKAQVEPYNYGSSTSEVSDSRPGLRPQRTKKFSGHFRPRKEATVSQEAPGHSQAVYQSTHPPHLASRSKPVGRLGSTSRGGSAFLQSDNQNEPDGRLRSVTKAHQLQTRPENGTSLWGDEGGRNRIVYEGTQNQTQRFGSASLRRAKQTVKEAIGEVFDYDKFHQELEELESERKRVEWLGRSLAMRTLDGAKLQQKQIKQVPALGRASKPVPASGSSGNKRHRSAISPLRDASKKMLRSDSGKKSLPLEAKADIHPLPRPLDGSLGNVSQVDVLHVGTSKLAPSNVGSKTQKSEGISSVKDGSLSRRPYQKLATEFKTSAKDFVACDGFEVPSLEKNENKPSFRPGDESDRPVGEQFAIKRKSLRPPGSIFKAAAPTSWVPGDSSIKGKKVDLSSGASTLEATVRKETAGNKCAVKPKNMDIPPGNGARKVVTTVQNGVSQESLGGRGSLNIAKRPEKNIRQTAEFPSELCKWLLTPDADLNDYQPGVLKPDLVSGNTEGAEPTTSCPEERKLERESWSERMKSFLLSCGALLPETNPAHDINPEQPSFSPELDVGADAHRDGTEDDEDLSRGKKEVLLPLRWPKVHDDDSEMLGGKPGRLDDTKNKVRVSSDVKLPQGNQKNRGSPSKCNKQKTVRTVAGGKRSPGKKIKVGKSFNGQKKGYDLLVTMLHKVSTGIAKQKQAAKSRSVDDVSERRIRFRDGKFGDGPSSLKAEERKGSPTANCPRDGYGKGPRKLRLVEVKDGGNLLLPISKEEIAQRTTRYEAATGVKDERDNQGSTLEITTHVEDSLEDTDLELGTKPRKSLRGSAENWLSTSGGFEFLDMPDEFKQNLGDPEWSEAIQKKSEFLSHSDPAGNFQQDKALEDKISYLSRSGGQTSADPLRNVDTQEEFLPKSWGMEKHTGREENSNRTQEIGDLQPDPVDSFMQVFQEYKETYQIQGLTYHGGTEAETALVADSELAHDVKNSDLKLQKPGTMSSSEMEEKLTESEELELALLELVIKTVLRGDLMKNPRSGRMARKEGPSLFTTHLRESQPHQVDQGVQASVHDRGQLSPTSQAGRSAKSSGGNSHQMEKYSRSCSCDEEGEWPEYLGMDDGNETEGVEMGSPRTKENPSEFTELETSVCPPATVAVRLQKAERACPSCPFPKELLERQTTERAQFPVLAEKCLTEIPSAPPSEAKKDAASVAESRSTSVQTNDLSAGQPASSLQFLPLFCLPDGRPFLPPLLTPYCVYPQYPMTPCPPNLQYLQIPPVVQNVQPTQVTAAVTTADNVPRGEELWSEQNELFPVIRSGEKVQRVASALAQPRRRKSQLLVAPDNLGDESDQENGDRQNKLEPSSAHFTVSGEDQRALEGQPAAEKGPQDYTYQLPATNVLENEVASARSKHTNLAPVDCSATLVPDSVQTGCAQNIWKEPGFSYYGDTDSYDGSGSSDISCPRAYPRLYPGVDAPFVGLNRDFEREDRAPTTTADAAVSPTEPRVRSPGEVQQPHSTTVRHPSGLPVGLHSLEGPPMNGQQFPVSWSGVPREPGLPLSEGEIDLGELPSEGECRGMYSTSGVLYKGYKISAQAYSGYGSEPGEVGTFVGHQSVARNSSPKEKCNLSQSLSEGEVRPGSLKQTEPGEVDRPRPAGEKSSSG
ncbi:hypothetical protein R1sor_006401 [Riccia sorocarpa]|uniref:Uncharacterized protein n=1 Tax=Riccia sorocarpa TaxID=122646 RepID=A0ABD3HRM3_9MARC